MNEASRALFSWIVFSAPAILAWGLAALPAPALAVPTAIPYVGSLTHDNGVPISGDVEVQAALFSVATDGAPVWGPVSLGPVEIWEGSFAVVLGDTGQPSLGPALAAGTPLWLQWTIDSVVLAPRQRVLSVPFAIEAGNAALLGGMAASAFTSDAELASYVPAPPVGAAPPPSPKEGALWYDTSSEALRIYRGGNWIIAGGTATNLGPDALATISHGSLTNAFADVTASYGGPPIAVPNGTPLGAEATVAVAEASGSTLTALAIDVELALDAAATLDLRVDPPNTISGSIWPLFAGPVAMTPGQNPTVATLTMTHLTSTNLASALGANPTGTWRLEVADIDAPPSGVPSAVRITGFSVRYGIVRSDHAVATGIFEAQGPLVAHDYVRIGSSSAACTTATEGALRYNASTKQLEFCDGAVWRLTWQNPLGQSPALPAPSCAAIRAANPPAPSALYWLDVDGGSTANAFQTWCDMETAGGGWSLALNLDTSDGHVMWWANDLWTNTDLHGTPATPFDGDLKTPVFISMAGTTELLITVHQQGAIIGWKRFSKVDTQTLHQYLQGVDNTLISNTVLSSNVAGINAAEQLVRASTNLYANRCVATGGACKTGATGSPDGDRISSTAATPSDNTGGGLGNWHDMGYCCSGQSYGSGKGCNGQAFRTVSEAQATWCGATGYFGTDSFAPPNCGGANANCALAGWSQASGIAYDYSIYVR